MSMHTSIALVAVGATLIVGSVVGLAVLDALPAVHIPVSTGYTRTGSVAGAALIVAGSMWLVRLIRPRRRFRPVREYRAATPQVERAHRAPRGVSAGRPGQGWRAGQHPTAPARGSRPRSAPGRDHNPHGRATGCGAAVGTHPTPATPTEEP